MTTTSLAAAAAATAAPPVRASSAAAAATQVAVRFVTRLPLEYRVPDEPVTVPTNLARYGLSQIINHLLGRGGDDDEEDDAMEDDASEKKRKKRKAVVPFDFLVGGELVRRPLDALLKAHGASAETAVHIEYFLAVPPPTPAPPAPADDWVDALVAMPSSSPSTSSSSSPSSGFVVAAGCCDGGVRLWSRASLLAGAAPDARAEQGRHPGGVDALAVATTDGGGTKTGGGGLLLLSSGRDGVARASLLPSSSRSSTPPVVVAELLGHADSVASIAACPPSTSSDSSYAATGCWDGSVKLWRLRGDPRVDAAIEAAAAGNGGGGCGCGGDGGDGDGDDASAAKRRKLSKKKKQAPPSSSSSSSPAAAAAFATPDPLLTVSNGGHTQCVSSLCWPSPRCLLTGSWDHSVRRWEVEFSSSSEADAAAAAAAAAAADDDEEAFPPPPPPPVASCRPTDTLHAGHAIFALAAPAGSDGRLVALGGASSEVRLWDTRVAVAAVADVFASAAPLAASSRLGSHGDWVSALAWHPTRPCLVASAGHDGKVKLWDIRGGSSGNASGNVKNSVSPPLAVLAAHDGKALALAWCLGGGSNKKDLLVSGGADGRVRAFEVAA